jgi:hypothetical protein
VNRDFDVELVIVVNLRGSISSVLWDGSGKMTFEGRLKRGSYLIS